MDRIFDKVLVIPPGDSYRRCLSKNPGHSTIDMESALKQHDYYVDILRKHGVQVEKLPVQNDFPDSIFVQDTALVGTSSKIASICRFGVPSRRGEEEVVADHLEDEGFRIRYIEEPGTVEGGDILVTDRDICFVGISERTNREGVEQLRTHFPGTEFTEVPVTEVFHLLSAVNFVGNGTLAICPDIVDTAYFEEFELIEIPKSTQDSKYGNKPINMVYLGDDTVLMPDAYPSTKKILEDHGYDVVTMDISEFWKGDAGTTCPMLPYYKTL